MKRSEMTPEQRQKTQEYHKLYKKKRYAEDPAWRSLQLERSRAQRKIRYQDPEYRAKIRQAQRKKYQEDVEYRKAYRKKYNDRKRLRYQQDLVWREQEKQRTQSPEYRKRKREAEKIK